MEMQLTCLWEDKPPSVGTVPDKLVLWVSPKGGSTCTVFGAGRDLCANTSAEYITT